MWRNFIYLARQFQIVPLGSAQATGSIGKQNVVSHVAGRVASRYSSTYLITLRISARYVTIVSSPITVFRSVATVYIVPNSVKEFLEDLKKEWPEVYELAARLRRGEELSDADREWVEELSEATGWDREDVVEDLENLERDPSERAERYRQLFEKYYSEALKYRESNDLLQAAEKIWGAVTALIKLYAAIKHVAIAH